MKTICGEVWYTAAGRWQGGIVIFENDMGNCPGLDQTYDNKEDAIAWAEDTALDYYGECIEQGDEAELGNLRIND